MLEPAASLAPYPLRAGQSTTRETRMPASCGHMSSLQSPSLAEHQGSKDMLLAGQLCHHSSCLMMLCMWMCIASIALLV